MKKLLITSALAVMVSAPAVLAEGKAVGQNPRLLAQTKCGNNGGGNDGEFLIRGRCIKGVGSEESRRDVDPAGT